MSWSDEEFASLDLGDVRLNRRVSLVAERLGASPRSSIPKACAGWAEVKAAYRLFDNESVSSQQVLAAHVERTLERMRAHPVVLCLSDTTVVDFSRHPATTGLGPLSFDYQSGFQLHPVLAVTPDRLCLGVLDAQWLVRDPETLGTSVATKKQRPLDDQRPARTALLTLRCARVTLRPPYRKGHTLPPVTVTVIRAQEETPPTGSQALDWILLTNRSATTLDEATTLLEWYVCRWQIEIYFRVLKAGCSIESLQLADFSRLQVAIAIYLIVAWRIQFLITQGRDAPDLPCDTLFDTDEWKAAWIVAKRTPPPDQPPTLQDMIRIVATLGGFLARTGDGQPGPKTIWTGLDMVRHFVTALTAQAEITAKTKAKRRRR